MEIRKWLPIVEDYARTCADGDYLRTVSLVPGKLSKEQKAHNVKNGLCHICGKASHIAKDCPDRDPGRPFERTRSRRRARKTLRIFRISRQYMTTFQSKSSICVARSYSGRLSGYFNDTRACI
jgi:hypothetical protein